MGRKFSRRHEGKPSEDLRLAFERDAAAILEDTNKIATIATMILQINSAMRHLFGYSALRESFKRALEYIKASKEQKQLPSLELAVVANIAPFLFETVAQRSNNTIETVRQRYHQYLMRATV